MLLLLLLALGLGSVPPPFLVKAFAGDNYTVSVCSGSSCVANSTSAFNLRTGDPKKLFYLEGSPYEWGFQTATLASSDVEAAATLFLEKIPLALIAPAWIAKHDGWAVRELEQIITRILIKDSVAAFWVSKVENLFDFVSFALRSISISDFFSFSLFY